MNDLSPEAHALIEDARPAERPDMSAKSRVRAALAAQLSMPPVPPSQTHAAPAAASGAGVATKLVLVCALTTAAVVSGVGVHHWMSASRTADRAGQSSLRPGASLQDPSALSEAPSLPPASSTIPIANAKSAISPAATPFDRARTPALYRSPNQNPTVARSASLQRRREQTAPAEHFVSAPNEPGGHTPFLPSAPQARTGETRITATPSIFAVPGEAARGTSVSYAGSLSVTKEPSTTEPSASPRTPELEHTGSGQHSGESASRSIPSRRKTGCSAKEELRLLDAAQIALREGRAKLALAMLDQHTSLCPSARFNEEHSTAHILALCLLDQREQALAEATQLATLAPTSPQLARLRTSCAAAGIEKAAQDKAAP